MDPSFRVNDKWRAHEKWIADGGLLLASSDVSPSYPASIAKTWDAPVQQTPPSPPPPGNLPHHNGPTSCPR